MIRRLSNNISSLVDGKQEDPDSLKYFLKQYFGYYFFVLGCLGVGCGIGLAIEAICKWMWN